jgi:hypothetical protein
MMFPVVISMDFPWMTAPEKQSAEFRSDSLPLNEKMDELILFKSRLRKILHRMNNDLTALALSVDCASFEEGQPESNGDRLKVIQDLVSSLTSDFREMTLLCRSDATEK